MHPMSDAHLASSTTAAETPDGNECSLAEALGIEIRFASDSLSPPVDRARLKALVRRELSPDLRRETCRLVATFRPWYDAWAYAIADEAAAPPD